MKSRLALWGQTGMFSLYHRGNLKSSLKAANGDLRPSKRHQRQLKRENVQSDRASSRCLSASKKMADTLKCLPLEAEWKLGGNSPASR
jgi:hypothetical protein